jgi:hypothetical protein
VIDVYLYLARKADFFEVFAFSTCVCIVAYLLLVLYNNCHDLFKYEDSCYSLSQCRPTVCITSNLYCTFVKATEVWNFIYLLRI